MNEKSSIKCEVYFVESLNRIVLVDDEEYMIYFKTYTPNEFKKLFGRKELEEIINKKKDIINVKPEMVNYYL